MEKDTSEGESSLTQTQQQEEVVEPQEILTEAKYQNWVGNSPYLYNTLYTQTVTWPSLTVQWLPQNLFHQPDGYSRNKILYATNTSGQEQDHVIIGKLKFPFDLMKQKSKNRMKKERKSGDKQILPEPNQSQIEVFSMVKHDGQINRARYNPFDPQIIATKSSDHGVYVFNYIQHSKQGVSNPNSLKLHLVGHEDEGFGLCWNYKKEGVLVSGSNDGRVLVWDINSKGTDPTLSYGVGLEEHNSPVNDVAFHKHSSEILGSGDDEGKLCFYDCRDKKRLTKSGKHHKGEIYSIDFSGKNPFRYVTGGSDRIVAVWDMRSNARQLVKLEGHSDSITKVEFSPNSSNIIWSSSLDTTLVKWDLNYDRHQIIKISKQHSKEAKTQKPKQNPLKPKQQISAQMILLPIKRLKAKVKCIFQKKQKRQLKKSEPNYSKYCKFVHGGHKSGISDFNIHPKDDSKIVSTDENNEIHIFDPIFRGLIDTIL